MLARLPAHIVSAWISDKATMMWSPGETQVTQSLTASAMPYSDAA
jgi:hypothetical protein